MAKHYELESDILDVVKGFETCSTDKTCFKHKEHVTVAVVYLQDLSVPQAVDKMRAALLAFVEHHGVPREKYSEEVTVFWMQQVSLRLGEAGDFELVDKCNFVLDSLEKVNGMNF